VLIVEVQEPTDQSVILEWNGFAIDGATVGHLRLGFDVALHAVDRTAWDIDRLSRLRAAPGGDAGRRAVLPDAARPFFWLEQLRPDTEVVLDPAFAVLIVTMGEGAIAWGEDEQCAAKSGQTFLVPYDSGAITVTGAVEILRCLPPASAHDEKE
jgi:mannose-6-phosphate isomerase